MYSIQADHLTYRFGQQLILNNVSLLVPEGSIYGFLGPNGAGKTTTLRLVTGLLRLQEGAIRIMGKDFQPHRLSLLQKIGTLIEQPSLYAHLSARENLNIYRNSYNCSPKRINEALDIVGLTNTGNKPAGSYSLGMKQRLALAIALLHDPPLLILDEPANGLDPGGIIEMRRLLLRLNQEWGKTILLSSHLLSEVQKIATHAGILHNGNMLFQGPLGEYDLETQFVQLTQPNL